MPKWSNERYRIVLAAFLFLSVISALGLYLSGGTSDLWKIVAAISGTGLFLTVIFWLIRSE